MQRGTSPTRMQTRTPRKNEQIGGHLFQEVEYNFLKRVTATFCKEGYEMIHHILAAVLSIGVIYCVRNRKDFRQAGEQYGWYGLGVLTLSYALLNIVDAQFDIGEHAALVDFISTHMRGMGIGMLAMIMLILHGRKKTGTLEKDAEQESGHVRK